MQTKYRYRYAVDRPVNWLFVAVHWNGTATALQLSTLFFICSILMAGKQDWAVAHARYPAIAAHLGSSSAPCPSPSSGASSSSSPGSGPSSRSRCSSRCSSNRRRGWRRRGRRPVMFPFLFLSVEWICTPTPDPLSSTFWSQLTWVTTELWHFGLKSGKELCLFKCTSYAHL
jgi:hypothetical protein